MHDFFNIIKLKNKCLILSFCFFLSTPISAEQTASTQKFSQRLSEIEQLKDYNITLAFKQLTAYKFKLASFPLEQQIQYYKLLSEIYIEQAEYQQCKIIATKGLALTRKLTSPSLLIADLLYMRGFAFESLGFMGKATEDYLNGLDVAESLHDNVTIAKGLINLGAIYYLTEKYERSLIVLNDAAKIANKTDDEELKGSVNSELGILYAYLGQEEQSVAFYQQSFLHFKNAGKILSAQNSLRNIASYHTGKKQYEEVIDIYNTIIAESDVISNKEIMYSVYSGLAWAYLKKKSPNPEAAYQYLLIAGMYIDDIEQHTAKMQYLLDKSYILKNLERYDEALESLFEADKIFANKRQFSSYDMQAYINVINLKANIYHALGRFKLAYQLKSETLKLIIQQRQKNNVSAVEEVRLRFESEQADLHKKLLENKKAIQSIALNEAQQMNKQQQIYLVVSTIALLIFAWLLVKVVQGQHSLKKASRIDALTGVYNRRRLMQQGQRAFAQAQMNGHDISMLMIDIDYFKRINDQLGHSAGDKVLSKIAQLGVSVMRKTDFFGRFGGEEFIAFLPKTSLPQALIIAERLRKIIYEYTWQKSLITEVSISVGVASLHKSKAENINELIKAADELLYQAKHQGRNKVCG